jgi:hypothetical protein
MTQSTWTKAALALGVLAMGPSACSQPSGSFAGGPLDAASAVFAVDAGADAADARPDAGDAAASAADGAADANGDSEFTLDLGTLEGNKPDGSGAQRANDGWTAGDVAAADSAGDDLGSANDTAQDAAEADDVWLDPQACPPASQKVYLLTKQYQLLAYSPATKALDVIGNLECPAEYATWPFSMAVDRKGGAWVMYSSGELFAVSTANAACQPTPWQVPSADWMECGMGFAADGAKGTPAGNSESLYLGSPKGKLGKLNLQQWQVTPMGPLAIQPGWPELTGTAMGELWGFFPQSQPMKIARIAKDTGQVDQVKSVDSLGLSPVKNWAFAHWGGKMLVFYQGEKDASTSVYAYDPADGSYGLFHAALGYPVVGAGVSTCAPTSWVQAP